MKKPSRLLFILLNLGFLAVLVGVVLNLVYAPSGPSLELTSNLETVEPGQLVEVRYKVLDENGDPVMDFDRVQEKLMHLVVVREDLTQFQHLHPDLNKETGEFSVDLTFDGAGTYELYADFTPEHSTQMVLPFMVNVGESTSVMPEALALSGVDPFDFEGLHVTPHFPETITAGNSFSYSFDVTQDEKAVSLEDFLGAQGQSAVIHEGDLSYENAHPKEKGLDFEVVLDEAGLYKSFTQFQVSGRIYTLEYTFEVK